jgi:hypothetical protein
VPLKVAFQDIHGKKYKEVVPEKALLDLILPFGDARFPLLGWVDPYSNTIFNSNQMWPLLKELDQLARTVSTEEGKKLLVQICEIAIGCRDAPQTYLRFIGD